jgi:hypothetical protein
MPKYKTLAAKVIAGTGLCVSIDAPNSWGIWDRKSKSFVSNERWTRRKDAEDFLAVSIMLGKDVRHLDI